MKNVNRIRWLSRFDMEPLLGFVLMTGMFLGMGLILAGFMVNRIFEKATVEYQIRAASIPRLILADLGRTSSADFRSHLLADFGFSILLITPYARLFVTWLYMVFVKRRWKSAIYTSIALVLLGIILFSDVVVASDAGHRRWYLFKTKVDSAQAVVR